MNENKKVIKNIEGIHFVNLCDHRVSLFTGETVLNIPRSGEIARCKTHNELICYVNTVVPITAQVIEYITGLPEPKENTIYIVSKQVRDAAPERHDLVAPGVKIKSVNGTDNGCTTFSIDPSMIKNFLK